MNGFIVSTDRLISASEARKKFGQLLGKIASDKSNYFIILANGRLAGILIHPDLLQKKGGELFHDLESIRSEWGRYTSSISKALEKLDKLPRKKLPPLLQ